MNASTQIRSARQSRDQANEWDNIVSVSRTSKWIKATWLASSGLFALLGAFLVFNHQPTLISVYAAPVAFLAITAASHYAVQRRREKTLFMIIAREAPELSRKLRGEGIG